MKKYISFLLVLLSLLGGVLYWLANQRIDEFHLHHKQSSIESTRTASDNISHFLFDQKRLLRVFVRDQSNLIQQVQKNSNDAGLKKQLDAIITSYFPYLLTYTIADSTGALQLDNSRNLVGNMCLADIKSFIRLDHYEHKIHPSKNAHHFDVMAKLNANAGVIFVSFHAKHLVKILANTVEYGHEMMLVDPSRDNLIEISSAGVRSSLNRTSNTLSDSEKANLLSKVKIRGTEWEVVDFYQTHLDAEYIKTIYFQSTVIFIVFFLFVSVFIYYLIRQEVHYRKTEQAKDQLLSDISHELRTPLTAIRGSLGLVANGVTGKLTDKSYEIVNVAINNCERMEQVVNDLLYSQEFESIQARYDKKPLNLVDLANMAIKENADFAKQYNVNFTLSCSVDEIIVCADEMRMFQVLSNLLTNAAKFGKMGDEVIVILTKTNTQARISVTDHGEGVSAEFQNEIFENLNLANLGSDQKNSGSGLGLSIVKKIMDEHGGSVGFETNQGIGTTFFVDMPLAQATSC